MTFLPQSRFAEGYALFLARQRQEGGDRRSQKLCTGASLEGPRKERRLSPSVLESNVQGHPGSGTDEEFHKRQGGFGTPNSQLRPKAAVLRAAPFLRTEADLPCSAGDASTATRGAAQPHRTPWDPASTFAAPATALHWAYPEDKERLLTPRGSNVVTGGLDLGWGGRKRPPRFRPRLRCGVAFWRNNEF